MTNIVATASQHMQAGDLFGYPVFVDFTPASYTFDYGDGTIKVPNPAHPVYQQLRNEWSQTVSEEVGSRLKTIAIRRGVIADVDTAAVAAARANAESGEHGQ